ncbi:hypothetical protein Q7C23_00820 [Flavobacterium sp. LAR06]
MPSLKIYLLIINKSESTQQACAFNKVIVKELNDCQMYEIGGGTGLIAA